MDYDKKFREWTAASSIRRWRTYLREMPDLLPEASRGRPTSQGSTESLSLEGRPQTSIRARQTDKNYGFK